MPRLRLFLVILMVYPLAGCTRLKRWLDLDAGAPPSRRTPLVAGKVAPTQPAQPDRRVKCCWCVLKPSGRNQVEKYVGREACEAKSNQWTNGLCRAVEIEEPACRLVSLSEEADGRKCRPNPLHYTENGQRKEIAVPEDYHLTCNGESLADDAMFSAGAQLASGLASAGGSGQPGRSPEDYCSCGRSPSEPGNCQLLLVVNGVASKLASAPKPAGAPGCTAEVCLTLFKDNDWRPKCPGYVPGDP